MLLSAMDASPLAASLLEAMPEPESEGGRGGLVTLVGTLGGLEGAGGLIDEVGVPTAVGGE